MCTKRFLSIFLSFIFLLQLCITSYAGSIGGNGGGSNSSTATGGGGKTSSPILFNNEQQGYRFTFVDTQTGQKVGNTVDILRSNPTSLDFNHNLCWFTGSAAEPANKCTNDSYYYFTYADVANYLNDKVTTPKEMPWWFSKEGAVYGGESNSFKDWLLSSQAQQSLSGNFINQVVDSNVTASENAKKSNNTGDGAKKAIDKMNKTLDEYEKLYKTSTTLTAEQYVYFNYLRDIYNKVKPYYEMYDGFSKVLERCDSLAIKESDVKSCYVSEEAYLAAYNTANAKLNADIKRREEQQNANVPLTTALNIDIPFIFTSYAAVAPSSGGGSAKSAQEVYNQITSSGKIDVETYGYIAALLTIGSGDDENKPSIFSGTMPSKEFYTKFLTNEISLIVEGVLWGKPQSYSGINYPYYILFTARNITYMFLNDKWSGWDSSSGMNTFRVTNVCIMDNLHLEEDESAISTSQNRNPIHYNSSVTYLSGANKLYRIGKTDRLPFDKANVYFNSGVGLGMHTYGVYAGSPTYTTTTTIPDIPYWTPQADDTFTVVKMYRIKSFTGTTVPVAYFRQDNLPRTINIGDEREYGWRLVEWYTTPTACTIEANKSAYTYEWNKVKKQNQSGKLSGTEAGTITVDSSDKVLYILYESYPTDSDDKITVIRVYDNEDGDTDKVETSTVDEKPYVIPDGGDYTYTESKVTQNSPNTVTTWDDSDGTSQGTPPEINYPDDTKTIYVHYQKIVSNPATQKIVLYENELSYNYDLRDLLQDRRLISIYDDVPAAPLVYADCPGHGKRNKHCTSKTYRLTDMYWTVAVQDNFDQNSLSFIKDWTYTSSMSRRGIATPDGGNGSSYKVTPQATYLLIRDKLSDVVTLYPKKNTGLLSELSALNLTENYTSTDTRKNHLRETDKTKQFYSQLFTQLSYSSSRDTGLAWWTKKYGRGSHTNEGTYNTSTAAGHSPDDANTAYSQANNVETRYFLGKAGTGSEKPSFGISDWQSKYKHHNYNDSYSEATLSFYPYLEYQYYYKNNRTAQSVMVTSSNLSTMKVYNAVQIGVYKKNDINANLTSTQWSTHARSLSFLQNKGISDKKSVLPGGAIQDIDMGNQGDTQIGVTLWQTCLRDELVETVQQNGFKVSLSEAKKAANDLQDEIKKSIGGYGLVQYGAEGVLTDKDDILTDGEELHENTDVSFVLGNSGHTSSDSKYYLRHDASGSNRANFDCLDTRIEHQYLYTVKSDTKGNVIVTVSVDGGAESELAKISKSQDVSKLLQNKEIALLDANTKLVTNYVKSIERNKGKARNGNKWYNEAHDGISVLRTEMSFDVGFGSGNAHRTNVLDPLLTAKADSKSDLYDFDDESKVRSSVYITSATSTAAEDSETPGYMGTVKAVGGMSDLDVVLKDIQSMVYTKNFYIPNANVSDLN